jgi:hypothetical protein
MRSLADLPGADQARAEQVATLGRRDAAPEVREAAAVALGSMGDRSPGALAAATSRNVVESLAAEAHPRVRAMLAYAVRDSRDPAVADALLAALRDPELEVRVAAADQLGDVAAAHRARAVSALAARFETENDRDARVTIVTAIVRAGKLQALQALQGLRGGDLQPTIDDYVEGLRSGEDNVDRLFAMHLGNERARNQIASPRR